MKDLHFIIGLPRTGSTILTALLDQNPNFYATGTSPLPSVIENVIAQMGPQNDFNIINHKTLEKQVYGLMRGCIEGWHSGETDKPVVFSKSRPWIIFYDELRRLYPDAKFIFCVRDLRSIVLSFEKLVPQFPFLRFPIKEAGDLSVSRLDRNSRLKYWLYHEYSALGIMHKHMPKFYDDYADGPSNFFIFKYEEFAPNPQDTMDKLYDFLGYEKFQHDFNNITFTPKEYDTAYWSYVDHTVGSKLNYVESDFSVFGGMNEEIINDNIKFYKFFYPELFQSSTKRNRF
jgi:sulfotransferase